MTGAAPSPRGNLSLGRQLIDAAVAGDLARVRELLDAGAETHTAPEEAAAGLPPAPDAGIFQLISLHTGNNRLNAAMYLAAFHGYEEIVDHFIARAAYDPLTLKVALFGAARGGYLPIVKKLVAAGADATFKRDYPLRESLARGHDDVCAFLVAATGCHDRALAYAAEKGRLDTVAGLLRPETDVRPALESLVRLMGAAEKPAPRLPAESAEWPAGFHMLLSFAAARGDDMNALCGPLATEMARQGAVPAIAAFLDSDACAALENKKELLTRLLLPRPPENAQTADYGTVMARLVAAGADAQRALEIGVENLRPEIVTAALQAGADPRRHAGRSLLRARQKMNDPEVDRLDAAQVFGDLIAVEALGLVMDEKVFREGQHADAPMQAWRRADAKTGRTGLMAAFAIGQAEAVVAAARQSGDRLTVGDLLAGDKSGYRALDCLEDGGQLALLFEENLWRDHRAEYETLWQAMTPGQQETQSDAHARICAAFAAQDGLRRLRQTARQDRRRFRL